MRVRADVLVRVRVRNASTRTCTSLGANNAPLAATTSRSVADPSAIVFDPLDGSSNIDAGVNVGTIFGVYRVPEGKEGSVEDVLRPGKEMVAAGYTM